MAFKIIRKDGKSLRALKKAAGKGSFLGVGIFGPSGSKAHKGSKLNNAQIGSIHEFGIGKVPQRSFIRSTLKEQQGAIKRDLEKIAKKAADDGSFTNEKGLAILGLKLEGKIKQKMSAGVPPPNAESTIKKKGSATPLIDTGQLRSSVTHKVFGSRSELKAGS